MKNILQEQHSKCRDGETAAITGKNLCTVVASEIKAGRSQQPGSHDGCAHRPEQIADADEIHEHEHGRQSPHTGQVQAECLCSFRSTS